MEPPVVVSFGRRRSPIDKGSGVGPSGHFEKTPTDDRTDTHSACSTVPSCGTSDSDSDLPPAGTSRTTQSQVSGISQTATPTMSAGQKNAYGRNQGFHDSMCDFGADVGDVYVGWGNDSSSQSELGSSMEKKQLKHPSSQIQKSSRGRNRGGSSLRSAKSVRMVQVGDECDARRPWRREESIIVEENEEDVQEEEKEKIKEEPHDDISDPKKLRTTRFAGVRSMRQLPRENSSNKKQDYRRANSARFAGVKSRRNLGKDDIEKEKRAAAMARVLSVKRIAGDTDMDMATPRTSASTTNEEMMETTDQQQSSLIDDRRIHTARMMSIRQPQAFGRAKSTKAVSHVRSSRDVAASVANANSLTAKSMRRMGNRTLSSTSRNGERVYSRGRSYSSEKKYSTAKSSRNVKFSESSNDGDDRGSDIDRSSHIVRAISRKYSQENIFVNGSLTQNDNGSDDDETKEKSKSKRNLLKRAKKSVRMSLKEEAKHEKQKRQQRDEDSRPSPLRSISSRSIPPPKEHSLRQLTDENRKSSRYNIDQEKKRGQRQSRRAVMEEEHGHDSGQQSSADFEELADARAALVDFSIYASSSGDEIDGLDEIDAMTFTSDDDDESDASASSSSSSEQLKKTNRSERKDNSPRANPPSVFSLFQWNENAEPEAPTKKEESETPIDPDSSDRKAQDDPDTRTAPGIHEGEQNNNDDSVNSDTDHDTKSTGDIVQDEASVSITGEFCPYGKTKTGVHEENEGSNDANDAERATEAADETVQCDPSITEEFCPYERTENGVHEENKGHDSCDDDYDEYCNTSTSDKGAPDDASISITAEFCPYERTKETKPCPTDENGRKTPGSVGLRPSGEKNHESFYSEEGDSREIGFYDVRREYDSTSEVDDDHDGYEQDFQHARKGYNGSDFCPTDENGYGSSGSVDSRVSGEENDEPYYSEESDSRELEVHEVEDVESDGSSYYGGEDMVPTHIMEIHSQYQKEEQIIQYDGNGSVRCVPIESDIDAIDTDSDVSDSTESIENHKEEICHSKKYSSAVSNDGNSKNSKWRESFVVTSRQTASSGLGSSVPTASVSTMSTACSSNKPILASEQNTTTKWKLDFDDDEFPMKRRPTLKGNIPLSKRDLYRDSSRRESMRSMRSMRRFSAKKKQLPKEKIIQLEKRIDFSPAFQKDKKPINETPMYSTFREPIEEDSEINMKTKKFNLKRYASSKTISEYGKSISTYCNDPTLVENESSNTKELDMSPLDIDEAVTAEEIAIRRKVEKLSIRKNHIPTSLARTRSSSHGLKVDKLPPDLLAEHNRKKSKRKKKKKKSRSKKKDIDSNDVDSSGFPRGADMKSVGEFTVNTWGQSLSGESKASVSTFEKLDIALATERYRQQKRHEKDLVAITEY